MDHHVSEPTFVDFKTDRYKPGWSTWKVTPPFRWRCRYCRVIPCGYKQQLTKCASHNCVSSLERCPSSLLGLFILSQEQSTNQVGKTDAVPGQTMHCKESLVPLSHVINFCSGLFLAQILQQGPLEMQ